MRLRKTVLAFAVTASVAGAMLGGSAADAAVDEQPRPSTAAAAAASPVTLRQTFSFENGRLLRTGRTVRLSIPRNADVVVSGRGGTKTVARAGDVGLRHVPGGPGLAPSDVTVTLAGAGGRVRMLAPKVRVTSRALVISGKLPPTTRTRGMDDPPPGWYVGADGAWYPTAGEVAMMMDVPMCSGTYVNTFVTCMGTSFSYVFSENFITNVNGKSTEVNGVSLIACLPYEYMEDQDDATLTVSPPISPQFSIPLNQDCDSSMLYPYGGAQMGSTPNGAASTSEYAIFGAVFASGE